MGIALAVISLYASRRARDVAAHPHAPRVENAASDDEYLTDDECMYNV